MLEKAKHITEQIIAWRREFHQHPELGFQEQRTADRVAQILRSLGYQVRTNVGRSGVVGDIGEGSPTIAIRADMDALPILETNDVPYASQIPGVMHACGHDAHTAMLLGTATLLAEQPIQGRIRLIFQPAEEVGDEEGVSGAPRMIQDGAMEGVDMVLALHVDSSIPVGDITIDAGTNSAGVDTFFATIIGKGGHGSTPQKVIDPIHIAGHVILAMHEIVSRGLYPFDPAVVSIGSLHAGSASNVIPNKVELTGTIRFMKEDVQKRIHEKIESVMQIASAMGGEYQLKWEIGYPPTYNDEKVANLIKQVGVDMLGQEHVYLPKMEMGAEDFGFFGAHAPAAMFYLGARIEGNERRHHNPTFDIDEGCLPIGTALLTAMTLKYLRDNTK